jgi:glycosyltransferase involved in cell wall biosynthesis
MKIGYFSSRFPYADSQNEVNYPYGGSIIATYHIVKEVIKRKYEVSVFTSSSDSKTSVEINNLKLFRYGNNLNFHTSGFSSGLYYKPLSQNIDLVHTSFDIPPSPLAGYFFSKKKKIPLIVTYHGDWDSSYGTYLRRLFVYLSNIFITDRVLKQADVIISPSKSYIDQSKFLKKYREKIVVIPNGVELKEFDIMASKAECRKRMGFPENGKIILFFGFLSHYKGPDVLLDAYSKIRAEHPDTLLVFAGKGILMEKLKTTVKILHLEEHVKFLGYVDNSLKPVCYKACDIFCLPSTMMTECYPLSILESMAAGVPVVASEIGGIPDIIQEGITGMLVNPNDSEDLQKKLIFLLQNEMYLENLKDNAMREIEKYSWDIIAEKTSCVYRNLINLKYG